MKSIARLTILLIVVSIMGGCSSIGKQISDTVFIPHWNSDIKKDENVSLKVIEKKEKIVTKALPLATITPLLVGEAFNRVGKILEDESKRYIASYSASYLSHKFYESPTTDNIILLGINFQRKVTGDWDKNVLAMEFCAFTLPTRDNTFFQIVPISYSIKKSKAKIIAFDFLSPFGIDLFQPWEIITKGIRGDWKLPPIDNNVDLSIAISLTGYWIDKNMRSHFEVLGTQEIKFRKVELGKNYPKLKMKLNEWKTLIDKAKKPIGEINLEKLTEIESIKPGDKDKNEKLEKLIETNLSCENLTVEHYKNLANLISVEDLNPSLTMLPKVPRSFKGTNKNGPILGDGHYSITVTATEVDDYSERIKEIHKTFEENKEGWQQKLNNLFQGSS